MTLWRQWCQYQHCTSFHSSYMQKTKHVFGSRSTLLPKNPSLESLSSGSPIFLERQIFSLQNLKQFSPKIFSICPSQSHARKYNSHRFNQRFNTTCFVIVLSQRTINTLTSYETLLACISIISPHKLCNNTIVCANNSRSTSILGLHPMKILALQSLR